MPDSRVVIRSSDLSAEIDPLGAQLSVLKDRDGRDLLWHGDPAIWAGRAPVLFPIVGSLAGGQYRLGERSYALSRHGFARGKPFEVVEAGEGAALFRLREDESTLAVYPFRFMLEMSFSVTAESLSVIATAHNVGDRPMPASLGFHPGFLWPLPYGQPRDAHFLEFESEEPAPVRRIGSDGLLLPDAQPTPIAGRRLALDDALFRDDVLILDELRSHSVTYGSAKGPRIQLRFSDARYLGLWTKPGAPFICLEPWQGITDPTGFTSDFLDKPGVFIVPPGGSRSLSMIVSIDRGLRVD